ncbi:MAG: M23 family metallopeptidase [Croceibacterium sp.]
MALNLTDRLLTVVVTATLTSAAWVVAGSGLSLGTLPTAGAAPGSPAAAGIPTAAPAAHPVAIDPPAASQSGSLVIPVAGVTEAQLTDTFTDARGGGARLHEALDIMAPAGTSIVAAAPGTVEKLFLSDAGGNTIYVRSQDRSTIYYYAHLRDYAPGLVEGQQVTQGQALGTVGSTGDASPDAPHLHFAIMRTTPEAKWWDPASAINPYPLLRVRTPGVH